MHLLDTEPIRLCRSLVIHDNFAERMASGRRRFIQISALSAFDCSVVDYSGIHG